MWQKMTAIFNYIKLQFKLEYSNEKSNKRGNVISAILSVLVFAVIMGLIYVFSGVMVSSFDDRVAMRDIAELFVFVIETVLMFQATGLQIKYLFKPADLKISARFPLSAAQFYIASSALIYFNMIISSAMTFLPIMLIFGAVGHILTPGYAGLAVLATLLAPLIPFSLSMLFSVPLMYVLSLLENKNYLRLILFILLIVGFFVAYDYVLNMMADYFIHRRIDSDTNNLWTKIIIALNSAYNPFVYVRDLLFADTVLRGLGIVILCTLLANVSGCLVSVPTYAYVRRSALEGSRNIFNKKIRLTNDKPVVAMMKREIKETVRTRVYAYFYLGVATATPVMVFFCDRLVTEVGQSQLGSSVAMSASVLVITSFITMINVFSASAINKEGERFYITKIIPVGFKNQLLIKGFINAAVSVGALIICCFVIGVLEFLSAADTAVLFTSELLLVVALIFTGFNLNLKYVNLKTRDNGDTDETNVTILMIIGIVISAVLTTSTIFICYFCPVEYSYIPLYLTAVLLLVVNISVFFTTAEKKYFEIEPR